MHNTGASLIDSSNDSLGTSACPNGRFHCPNIGHRAQTLPSSRVNDGVCDCCDGADEWANEEAQCSNTCSSLGEAAREAHTKHRAAVESGYRRRQELAKEGARSMDERRSVLEKRRRELEDLQPLRSTAETLVSDAEKRENDAKNEEDTAWNGLFIFTS